MKPLEDLWEGYEYVFAGNFEMSFVNVGAVVWEIGVEQWGMGSVEWKFWRDGSELVKLRVGSEVGNGIVN